MCEPQGFSHVSQATDRPQHQDQRHIESSQAGQTGKRPSCPAVLRHQRPFSYSSLGSCNEHPMAERVGARDRLYTALIFRLENPHRILMSTQAIIWTSQSVWLIQLMSTMAAISPL